MKAECTWGEGPDVLVVLDGTGVICYEHPKHLDKFTHGLVSQGSLDLTSKEARTFAAQLIKAADAADELQKSWEAEGKSKE